jgi:DMSO/TMAO reductase YedYZ molybdopterin-dependent catalytic subunit
MKPAADIVSPDTERADRIPPGQSRTVKWPVLHAGEVPKVDLASWDLRFYGLVDQPVRFSWDELRALPAQRVFADMHCVTTWSLLDNVWEGVLVREVMTRVGLRPEARFVLVHAEEGWTTNLPLEDFLGEDCLFAWAHNGEQLDPDHGAPLRLVVPRLYAWKSAKWVRGIEFLARDTPGFWERNGYHMRGDPWREERYW